LTGELIAHELGHTLGMLHDCIQCTPKYVYRTYKDEFKECRGLMDYINDGVGWSKCSASDFTRVLTNGGKNKPCLPLTSN